MIYTIDLKKLKDYKGKHCPCRLIKNNTTICPCDEFCEKGVCICGIFKKVKQNEKKK